MSQNEIILVVKTMFKNKRTRVLTIVLGLSLVLSVFQNCSDVSFSTAQKSTDPGPGTQGTLSATQNFTFGPVTNKIDILVVVDNSGSMEAEQANLGAGFNTFISSLSSLDWQIGVITTDLNDNGRFVGPAQGTSSNFGTQYIMNPNTTNVASVFQNTVQRRTSSGVYLGGSGDERAIYAAQLNIDGRSNPDVAQGFYRDGANLAVVILSDEDERSCGGDANAPGCGSQYKALDELDKPQTFINNFSMVFNGLKTLLVNSIVIKPSDTACYDNQNLQNGPYGTGGKYGNVYAQLTNMTAGVLGSICDNGAGGFDDDLKNISMMISNQVNPQTVTLNHTPKSAPTVTFLSGAVVSHTWTPGTPRITFSNYPANSSIKISYTYE